MTYLADTKPLTLADFAKLRASGEKITMVTAYDSSFAIAAASAGVEILLIGDSLGNVVQGQTTTLPVTLEHMEYHTACVARPLSRASNPRTATARER